MLPSFFIIGAARAATTTLWSILSEHPDIFLPDDKEPHYFLGGAWSNRGLPWYESLFADGRGRSRLGEASTGYSMFPIFQGVPERVSGFVPDARIIYVIRHPVQRMTSQWVQAVTSGREYRTLEEAIVERSVYFFSSCYGLQLSQWLARYPREAVLVLRSEDLGTDLGATLDRILRHLDLPPGWRPEAEIRANRTDFKLRVPTTLRHVSRALSAAGLESAAWRISRRSRLKQRIGLATPFLHSELQLPDTTASALAECFRSDFRMLRQLLGDEIDLYGLA